MESKVCTHTQNACSLLPKKKGYAMNQRRFQSLHHSVVRIWSVATKAILTTHTSLKDSQQFDVLKKNRRGNSFTPNKERRNAYLNVPNFCAESSCCLTSEESVWYLTRKRICILRSRKTEKEKKKTRVSKTHIFLITPSPVNCRNVKNFQVMSWMNVVPSKWQTYKSPTVVVDNTVPIM